MAANIVAALKANGGKVMAHANTQLMFHGCYTVAEGGAQHLEDTADSLRSINEAVISNLNRIGITECRAWFAEGREKWLDATEAQKLGIIDEVVEDGAENPPEMRQTAARLAALATHFTTRQEYIMKIDESVKPVAEEPAPAPEAAPVEEPKTEEPTPAPAEEKPAKKTAAKKTAAKKTAGAKFAVGDAVQHKVFGAGTVVSVTPVAGDMLVEVQFAAATKKMMANYAPLTKVE